MVAGLHDLEQFVSGPKGFLQIAKVYLISPPWLNNTGTWEMDALNEVLLAADPRDLSEVEIYACTNGKRMVCSDRKLSEDRMVNRRQIYFRQMAH